MGLDREELKKNWSTHVPILDICVLGESRLALVQQRPEIHETAEVCVQKLWVWGVGDSRGNERHAKVKVINEGQGYE